MAAAKIVPLDRKRDNLRTQISRLSESINDSLQITELNAHLDIISKIQEKLDVLKEDYYKIVNEDDFEATEEALSLLDDAILKIQVSVKSLINKHEFNCEKSDSNSSQSSHSPGHDLSKNILTKLPKIPLPIFSGEFEQWTNFKTQFNTLIDDNLGLSENEKLLYLKGSLRGDAKVIETADDTYISLFKALEQRYENKRMIVDCHIKSILNAPAIKQESGKELRNFLDNVNKNLRSLKVLDFDRNNFSNAILLNIVLDKLDRESRKQFELTLKDNEVPSFDYLLQFLERRCQILNSINTNIPSKYNHDRSKTLFIKSNKVSKTCVACKTENHQLYNCDKFKNMKLCDRINIVKMNKLCYNCLSNFHLLSLCKSKSNCRVCKSFSHHSLLHKYSNNHTSFLNEAPSISPPDIQSREQVHVNENQLSFFSNGRNKTILINTAIIYIRDLNGINRPLRAILDSASHSNFISFSAANLLGLKKEKINIPVTGLNDSVLNIKSKVTACLSNEMNEAQWSIDFLIVPKITDFTPSSKIDISHLNIPHKVHLADPKFFIPQKIDILLGAEFFFEFLNADKIHLGENLYLQSSCFGYLVSGSISNTDANTTPKYCFLSKNLETLEKTLTSFWEIEEVDNVKNCNNEELNFCNEHYHNTHYRKSDGRYIVTMPFKPEFSESMLGNSKANTSKRLEYLWRRLERDPTLKNLYTDFLNEYKNLHHMDEIIETSDFQEGYYIPHHGILRPSSATTKLRVVFDASAKTTSGYSLNDLLCKGGVLQEDLFSLLVRFRKHIYAFTADIKQMFRMIEINPSQQKLLKILWKDSKSSLIEVQQLLTVTYGTTCAPYLATKTLHQLAIDERVDFPLASNVVLNDFYMDDCLSGSSDLHEFTTLQSELTQLLQRGGMTLHKWCSNNAQPSELQIYSLDRNAEEITVKTLGMLWNSSSDTFSYKVNISANRSFTKREVLSQIARIFDPLGLLGPVISKAKIFMQQLWLLKLEWNEQLPADVSLQWKDFIDTLPELESIKVPRCFMKVDVKSVVLNGFADASSRAYGAVIYIQTVSNTNEISNQLLCSKSRVAPTKTMTIPRLELSACLLLARLTRKVLAALKQPIDSVRLLSDSTIALAWINTPTNLLKTYVCNRVSEIKQLTKDFQWLHIRSEYNPADMVSRGLDVRSLAKNKLWWQGPELSRLIVPSTDTVTNSANFTNETYMHELKTESNITLAINNDFNFFDNLFNLTNNFHKLIRIVAFIYRFIRICKCLERQTGPLSPEEYERAETCLIRHVQVRYFLPEISALKKGSSVPQSSKLKFLNPFFDDVGILRVGGRLTNANIRYDHKYPIILPAGCQLTKIIFNYYHLRDFHVGPQALLNTVRLKFWPLSGRNMARKIVHDCVQCFKNKPIVANQLMGDLPPERVMPGSPFSNVGLDLCGPFEIKYKGQRKGTLQKIYVVIFVCMVTKAVHLEFVSDLTSAAIIATLKRFFARRGKSSVIFSDNATNFIGASAELKSLQKLASREDISSLLASEGISWKFSPPRAPNFGGLWEAGVKAIKYHLKRVVGAARLTLEEFLTVIIQIEGILNSRPLSPLSTDADNFQVLTPGHFLIGKPINSIPEPNLIELKDNLLNRWQRTQKMVQVIWNKWQNSYLSHLQQRNKWVFKNPNLLPGMLVLVKESQLPLCTWSLGRIIKVIPGADGNVRVADIRTPKGIFRRPISKISILPIKDNYVTSVN